MNLLIAVADYSKPGQNSSHFFVQVRNIYYHNNGNNVTVLNFSTNIDYEVDGIKVISLNSFERNIKKINYDLLICHAPNIRNHYKFLKKYEKYFRKMVFFFHGHEVLMTNKVYSKPYKFVRKSIIKDKVRDIYDYAKLYMWRKYYPKIAYKSHFVFVSQWMKDEFFKWVKIDENDIKCSITYNGVGENFEKQIFKYNSKKQYDFVTIRGNLDGSKYAVDFVNYLAKANPQYKFLLVGKGNIFKHIEKADNITWKDELFNHNQIIETLNKSRCALMPTRTDAQGLMACEMATFGIPLITSEIPVCHEIFDEFDNVILINNDEVINLDEILVKLEKKLPYKKNNKYFKDTTFEKELELFSKLLR